MSFHNVPPNGFPDLPDVEELEAVQTDVQNLKTMKAAKADIAPEFSATSNYAVGDMVYHDGTLYKCTTVHEAAAWNADHFAAATIGAEISAVKGDVSDLEETKANQITIAPFFSAETAYEVGDIVYYNGLSYRCTNAHDGEWDAADFAATTVAGELSELNSKFTWKQLPDIDDNNGHVISVDFNELLLIGQYGAISFIIPKGSGMVYARGGFYSAADDNGDMYASLNCSTNELTVIHFVYVGNSVIQNGVHVYYR